MNPASWETVHLTINTHKTYDYQTVNDTYAAGCIGMKGKTWVVFAVARGQVVVDTTNAVHNYTYGEVQLNFVTNLNYRIHHYTMASKMKKEDVVMWGTTAPAIANTKAITLNNETLAVEVVAG